MNIESGHPLREALKMEGKRITKVEIGHEPERQTVHQSEFITIHFDGGSSLKMTVGTNLRNLQDRLGVKEKEVLTDFILEWSERTMKGKLKPSDDVSNESCFAQMASRLNLTHKESKELLSLFDYCYEKWVEAEYDDIFGMFEKGWKQSIGLIDAYLHQAIVAFYYDNNHPDYCVQYALGARHIVRYKELEDMLLHAEKHNQNALMGKTVSRSVVSSFGHSVDLVFCIPTDAPNEPTSTPSRN